MRSCCEALAPLCSPLPAGEGTDLGDGFVSFQLVRVPNVHLDGIGEKVIGDPTYFLRPSGSIHEGLMTGGNLGHNLANLRFEPHVQHTVRLVHDQVGHLAQIDFPCLQKVVHAPWSGNHNICPPFDVA